MSKPRAKGLGRGLEALLGSDDPAPGAAGSAGGAMLALDALQPGRYQPRTRMDETALEELAASVRRHGVMQPILVRPIGAGRFEIIAGERRFRAARAAGLREVPVIVRDVPDEQALAMALIENIQREDLNPLEQAQAVKRLIDEFRYTHEQAADAIGRSRSATTNLLRLLNLAEPVQTMLLAGDIDMGHARALLALDRATQIMMATQVAQRRLSVREAEKLVARHIAGQDAAARGVRTSKRRATDVDRDVARLQERLAETLGTGVVLRQMSNGRGQIVIDFSGPDQFDALLQRLGLSLLKD